MAEKVLILDLDDTIFRTKSMDNKIFEPFFDHLRAALLPVFSPAVIERISADLWQNTWDAVIRKYNIPVETIMKSIRFLEELPLDLNISTYPDYHYLKALPHQKFLVTTSLTSLQKSKIRALKIENDFTEIIINDTFRENRGKKEIFEGLINGYNLVPEHTYVIGDNPGSEISAGNQLNMITVQVLREGVKKGDNARHFIRSFEELGAILNH